MSPPLDQCHTYLSHPHRSIESIRKQNNIQQQTIPNSSSMKIYPFPWNVAIPERRRRDILAQQTNTTRVRCCEDAMTPTMTMVMMIIGWHHFMFLDNNRDRQYITENVKKSFKQKHIQHCDPFGFDSPLSLQRWRSVHTKHHRARFCRRNAVK